MSSSDDDSSSDERDYIPPHMVAGYQSGSEEEKSLTSESSRGTRTFASSMNNDDAVGNHHMHPGFETTVPQRQRGIVAVPPAGYVSSSVTSDESFSRFDTSTSPSVFASSDAKSRKSHHSDDKGTRLAPVEEGQQPGGQRAESEAAVFKEVTPPLQTCRSRLEGRKRLFIIIVVCTFAILGLVLGLVLSNNNNGDNVSSTGANTQPSQNPASDEIPSSIPTYQPSLSPSALFSVNPTSMAGSIPQTTVAPSPAPTFMPSLPAGLYDRKETFIQRFGVENNTILFNTTEQTRFCQVYINYTDLLVGPTGTAVNTTRVNTECFFERQNVLSGTARKLGSKKHPISLCNNSLLMHSKGDLRNDVSGVPTIKQNKYLTGGKQQRNLQTSIVNAVNEVTFAMRYVSDVVDTTDFPRYFRDYVNANLTEVATDMINNGLPIINAQNIVAPLLQLTTENIPYINMTLNGLGYLGDGGVDNGSAQSHWENVTSNHIQTYWISRGLKVSTVETHLISQSAIPSSTINTTTLRQRGRTRRINKHRHLSHGEISGTSHSSSSSVSRHLQGTSISNTITYNETVMYDPGNTTLTDINGTILVLDPFYNTTDQENYIAALKQNDATGVFANITSIENVLTYELVSPAVSVSPTTSPSATVQVP